MIEISLKLRAARELAALDVFEDKYTPGVSRRPLGREVRHGTCCKGLIRDE